MPEFRVCALTGDGEKEGCKFFDYEEARRYGRIAARDNPKWDIIIKQDDVPIMKIVATYDDVRYIKLRDSR